MLTAERARKLLSYDPETGVFRWRVTHRRGEVAGTIDKKGYRHICIDYVMHKAHRLAFLMIVGEWPKAFIDHINHQPDDNRWSNLREAARFQNARNRLARKDAVLKGVSRTPNNTWRAQIFLNGKNTGLGTFATPEQAHAAYRRAAAEHFGEFACFEKGAT